MGKEGFFIKSSEMNYFLADELLKNSFETGPDLSELPSVAYLDSRYSDEIYLPVALFSSDLTPLQAIVKYSKEVLGLPNKKISKLIGRTVRTVWLTYRHVEKAALPKFKESSLFVPISAFHNDKLSALESLVSFMKKIDLTYAQISRLVARDQRTIWTVHARAKKKERVVDEK